MGKNIRPQCPRLEEWDNKACLNLYSENDITRHLTEFVNDIIPKSGFAEEDTTLQWLRIAIGFIACCFGLYGSLVAKFPKNPIAILVCATGFFCCSGLQRYFDRFILKYRHLCLRDPKTRERFFLRFVLNAPKLNSITLELTSASGRKGTVTNYLGAYFYENGVTVQEVVFNDLYEAFMLCKESGGNKDHSTASIKKLRAKKTN